MAITRKAMLIQARKKVIRQQITDLKSAAEKACRTLPKWVQQGDVRSAQAWREGATALHSNINKAMSGRMSLDGMLTVRDSIEFEIASLEAGV